MQVERLDVPVDGGTLAAWHTGAALDSGAPVVLAAHGITGNNMAWSPVRRDLGESVSLITPDLRGRGRSNDIGGPFGMAAHSDDQLAILDHLEVERAVLVGHSMGAYVMARFAADHPERVTRLVLVDGGLTDRVPDDLDVQATLDAVLGPAIARLSQTFASRDEYHDFWRQHPAFGNGDVDDDDLDAYADHDLVGDPPNMRSSVSEAAVRTDGADVLAASEPAHRLAVGTILLRAPRGLLDEPSPLIPVKLAKAWESERPDQREVVEVDDVNHYTIVMGRGAGTVAETITRYGANP
jgi:pimeloyl-ACP methyl ester carboxylesterase